MLNTNRQYDTQLEVTAKNCIELFSRKRSIVKSKWGMSYEHASLVYNARLIAQGLQLKVYNARSITKG